MTEPDITAKAEQLRAEATTLPTPGEVREIAARATARAAANGGSRNMTLDQVREVADKAVARAEEVAALLRRLSELLAEPSPEDPGGDQ